MIDLYHGSSSEFSSFDLKRGLGFKDFGRGIYLTPNKEYAEYSAKLSMIKKKKMGITCNDMYIYHVQVDEKKFGDMSVKRFDDVDKEWLLFVLLNRYSKNSRHDYDVVIGPVANSRLIAEISRYRLMNVPYSFVQRNIDSIMKNLHLQSLYTQYFFGTQRAVDALNKVKMGCTTVGKEGK